MGLGTEIAKYSYGVSKNWRNMLPMGKNWFAAPTTARMSRSPHDLTNFLAPLQLTRTRQDIQSWRNAVREAENPWFPFRVLMQQMYNDTVFDGHVAACWTKRKEQVLLKDFCITDDKGKEYTELTNIFKDKVWFKNVLNWAFDSNGFGYTLIALGDQHGLEFPDAKLVRRRNVSPDRMVVSMFEYTIQGEKFNEGEYYPWHLWIDTPSQFGESFCGYGLFYEVAAYQIYLRNNLGQNADYNEKFGNPIMWLKTDKTGDERDQAYNDLLNAGSSQVMVTDPTDKFEIIAASERGKGFETFANFEERLQKMISKIILGHGDALDSIQGSLGSIDDPVKWALLAKEKIDTEMLENFVNNNLFEKLRMNIHGFPLPRNLYFRFKNDKEKQEVRAVQDNLNKTTSEWVKNLQAAGYEVDPKKLSETLGYKIEEKQEEPTEHIKNIQNRLKMIYE